MLVQHIRQKTDLVAILLGAIVVTKEKGKLIFPKYPYGSLCHPALSTFCFVVRFLF